MMRTSLSNVIRYCALLFVLGVRVTLPADDSCPLTVRVLRSKNSPSEKAPVRIVDSSGKVVSQGTTDSSGLFRECNIGFDKYVIEVGEWDRCTLVVLRNVVVDVHPETFVVYENYCKSTTVGEGRGCPIHIRVADPDDKPIGAALVNGFRIDPYGKARLSTEVGGRLEVSVTAPGFIPQTVTIGCPDGFYVRREIVLQRK